ncbi:MAG: bacteriochlorophyll 4-vinyl reductase [Woeseiaceae bacterium]|nr:bacteriochlorophyll 4-vinyl reductase [Woeseiaceae bacterium]
MTQSAAASRGVGIARVGPNAILQYLPVLEKAMGRSALDEFLTAEHLERVPDGSEMIEEGLAAQFHQAVRRQFPDVAAELARDAGAGAADYIIANRIPAFARAILALLPRPVAEDMLSRSIADHAWTFAGSGEFRVHRQPPMTFEIIGNPIVRGECASQPICVWHAAVFTQLFSKLVGGTYSVTERQCCASGAESCRFELVRSKFQTY